MIMKNKLKTKKNRTNPIEKAKKRGMGEMKENFEALGEAVWG